MKNGERQLDKKLLLLVEDNPDDELLAIRAIKKNNFACDVVVARDGQEAVNLLFGNEQDDENVSVLTPDVVLLDLKLPKLDGIEVLKRIRAHQRTAAIPVVMLTSSNEKNDIYNSYLCGVNSFICKPVDFENFMEATKQLGTYWLSLNVTPFNQS